MIFCFLLLSFHNITYLTALKVYEEYLIELKDLLVALNISVNLYYFNENGNIYINLFHILYTSFKVMKVCGLQAL